jgi:hypothetical protein
MKAIILAVSALFVMNSNLFAQNLPPDYYFEIGLNGGLSGATRPVGPAEPYQGNGTNISGDYSLRINYLPSPHWMFAVDFGDRQWFSYGTWAATDINGQKLSGRTVTFDVADHAINSSIEANYMIPFYSGYSNYNKANLYFGVMLGLMNTVNDGSIGYSTYKASPDSNFRYVSKYDYESGLGVTFGIQMGYTWYFIPRLGLNVELAARYAHVNTIDEHYGSENNKFTTLYFPETIGLRWRF